MHQVYLALVLQVIAVSNSKIAELMDTAVTYDSSGPYINFTLPAMRVMASISAVQQGVISAAVSAVSKELHTGNMTTQQVSRAVLDMRQVSILVIF